MVLKRQAGNAKPGPKGDEHEREAKHIEASVSEPVSPRGGLYLDTRQMSEEGWCHSQTTGREAVHQPRNQRQAKPGGGGVEAEHPIH
jgi:hypothetical protein